MKTASSLSCLMALCFATMSSMGARAQTAPKTEMGRMAEHDHAPAAPSTSLTLTVDGKTTALSVAELQAMQQKTVMGHNEHTKAEESYTGVLLGDLLAKYGFPVR